jgi:hypothetical protein
MPDRLILFVTPMKAVDSVQDTLATACRPMFRCLLILLLSDVVVHAEVTFASLLREMTDRSEVTRWPAIQYQSLQASSFNRASKSPADPNGWFANQDQNFEIRKETTDGRTESVLMEHEGPGVITRIWAPDFHPDPSDPRGPDIRIYIDGETTPRFQCNMIDLLTGRGPVKPPFARGTTRAGLLHLPIPFRKSCKVTREGDSFRYAINYRAYAPGTRVESFHPDMLVETAGLLEETGRQLTNPPDWVGGRSVGIHQTIAAGQHAVAHLPPGPSAVRRLEFKLSAANLPVALRSTVLEIYFDGARTIWCPIGDFFSNVNGVDPYRMWEREVRPDGTMICRWIMPYQKDAALLIHNLAGEPVAVEMNAVVTPWDWTPDSLHFRTNWWTSMPHPPRLVRDLNFIEAQGRGLHVGDSLIVLNPLSFWSGEGDEKIYIDEDLERGFPSHFGTGTTDYHGWVSDGMPTRADEFSAPFAANVRVGGEGRDLPAGEEPHTRGFNIGTRTRSLDATPFTRRFKFDIEAFHTVGEPEAFLQYTFVTHWYGAPGTVDNRPPAPDTAAMPVPQIEDLARYARENLASPHQVFSIPGAVEFEDMQHIAPSQGFVTVAQNMGSDHHPLQWSNGGHLFVLSQKVGDSVTFTFHDQYRPRRLLLYPTLSMNFGVLDFFVNDRRAVTGWDGYDPQTRPGKPIDLGVHQPDGNLIRLKVVVTGKNPESTGHYFGLDAAVFQIADDAVPPR